MHYGSACKDMLQYTLCRGVCRSVRGVHGSALQHAVHMCANMCAGMLFVGGGIHALRTDMKGVAGMLIATLPRYHTQVDDNS